jgi:hypothetical protein
MLIAVGIFAALSFAVSLVTMRIQPSNEVEAYKKSLSEKGEKLEISEVLPPPVAPGQNGADAVEAAFNLFSDGGIDYSNMPPLMKAVAPGKAMTGWLQPDVRGSEFTDSWENVQAAVEIDRPATELLKQAANYPALDFHIDYSKGFEALLPHLAPLKHGAQKLSATALCDLHNGNAASAATNICALLALVEGERDDRMEISQLVRMAMAPIAAAATWELLQSTNVPDAKLAKLQKGWSELEFIAAMEKSCLMERAILESFFKKAQSSNAEFQRMFGRSASSGWTSSGDWLQDARDFAEAARDDGAIFLWRTSWSYSDELRSLKYQQAELEALRTIKTDQVFQPAYDNMTARMAALRGTNSSSMDRLIEYLGMDQFRWMFSEISDGSGRIIGRVLAAETCKRVVVTAIALKRFQLKHGNYPDTLSELTPEFLAAVSVDPVDGKPLRYHRNADGTFLLYSIGENGVDDGGDVTPLESVSSFAASSWYWQRGRDWVWPQPATPEEVQDFYEHPPK